MIESAHQERGWLRRCGVTAALVLIGCGAAAPQGGADALTEGSGETDSGADGGASETLDTYAGDATTRPPNPFAGRLLAIAHRGGARLAPEETMEAYANAWALGVDMLEVDVHATLDGVVVAMHDGSVDRTTDGEGKIRALTFAELRSLDAGYRFTPDGGATFPFRGQGVVVPTLEELLAAFPEALWSIEIKQASPSIVSAVIGLLEEAEMGDQAVIVSFSDETIAELRAAAPDLFTGFALAEMLTFGQLTEATEASYLPPGEVLQIPVETTGEVGVRPEYLERAHRLGLAIEVWTVNDRPMMETLTRLPIDGIMSDDPALLLEVMTQAGLR